MKILLLNENPVVSKLISLSSKKMSYDFEELSAYNENLLYYDVIVVDSDTPAPLKLLKEKCGRLIFLATRNQDLDIDAEILYKPFLPTDFLSLLEDKSVKKEDFNEALEDVDSDTSLDDLSFDEDKQGQNTLDELQVQSLKEENLNQKDEKQVKENLDLDLVQNEELIEDEILELENSLDDFEVLSLDEGQKEIDFDDQDAQFLGQKEDENLQKNSEDFIPIVEEELGGENEVFISPQDQIKEELAELDELDYNNAQILEHENLNEETACKEEVPKLAYDFDALKESDVQEALKEQVFIEDEKTKKVPLKKMQNDEPIISELSQSIAGAITSSIKDPSLKAALKGMNMNININISFKD